MTPERLGQILKQIDDDAIEIKVTFDRDTYCEIYEAAQSRDLKMSDMIQGICRMYVEHITDYEADHEE